MKTKLLVLFALLVIVGCGKSAPLKYHVGDIVSVVDMPVTGIVYSTYPKVYQYDVLCRLTPTNDLAPVKFNESKLLLVAPQFPKQ